MLRYLNALAIAALVGSAVYAYSIKYQTILYSEQILKTNLAIQSQRDDIGLLKAEWAHLIRPERLQTLADQHLGLQQLTLDQIVPANQLPDRVAKVDAIGRKLEDLGLGSPTNTPPDPLSSAGIVTPSTGPR